MISPPELYIIFLSISFYFQLVSSWPHDSLFIASTKEEREKTASFGRGDVNCPLEVEREGGREKEKGRRVKVLVEIGAPSRPPSRPLLYYLSSALRLFLLEFIDLLVLQ